MNDRALSPADAQADRIRYVVRVLRGWAPGLAELPFGFLLTAFLLLPWLREEGPKSLRTLSPERQLGLGLAFLLLCVLAQLAIRKWYTRRFGRVLGGGWKIESRTSKPGEMLFLLVLLGGVFFLETRFDSGLLGEPALLCLAAVFVTSWVFQRRELPHLGKLAMVLIGGVAFLHLLSIEGRSSIVWTAALFFLVFVLHAWMDHDLIVRTLPPLAEPLSTGAEVGDDVLSSSHIEAPQHPRSHR